MLPSSYVIRRGGTYSFRCRLPADLAARIGRREFVRAFGTDQAPIARLLAAGIGLRLTGLWTVLRMDGLGQDVEEALGRWFRQEVDRVWRQFRTGAHARDLVPPGATRDEELEIQRAALRGDADNQLHHLLEDYQKGDYGAAGTGTRSVVASLPAPFDDGDQRFTMLAKRVMEALGEVEEARLRWAGGDPAFVPSLPSSAPQAPAPAHDDAEVPTLEEVAERYLAHRQAERNTSRKMVGQLRGQLKVVMEELGPATKVTAVTPIMAGKVFSAFRDLPGGFRTHDALKGLPLFKAAEVARKLELGRMSPKTVNNHMTTVRGLFREACDQGVLDANPFVKKHITVEKVAGSELGFTSEELELLLTSPVFVGCERAGRPFQPGTCLLNDWRFWLPLTAMLTGARIAELCQLQREDVREERGVLVLDVTSRGGKRVKTRQSERIIPVHDELVRLGFLGYLRTRPSKAGIGSLFGIPKPKNDDWGAKAGNWFREKLLPSRLGTGRRDGLGFHSFRHNVESSVRAAGVRKDTSDRLTGHKAADVAAGYGRYEARAAKDAVMRIELPPVLGRIPARS